MSLQSHFYVLSSRQDYYPFGWKLPGRELSGAEDYRYGYQGQFAEEDKETGWNQFELRLWDGRIGRWMSTDPYGQYPSPYLGMGNNPIQRIDPDGGTDYYKKTGEKLGSDGVDNDLVYQVGAGFKQLQSDLETYGGKWYCHTCPNLPPGEQRNFWTSNDPRDTFIIRAGYSH